jgi:phosphate/sulfate permease
MVGWEESFTTVIEVLVDIFIVTGSIVGGKSVVREVCHLITAIQIN